MQGLLHHLILGFSSAVQFTTHHYRKIFFQIKMFQDALYVYLGLTGCHCQEIPLRLKRFQHLRNTVIDLIFKKSRILKALSVFCHSFFCLFGGETVEFHKAVP